MDLKILTLGEKTKQCKGGRQSDRGHQIKPTNWNIMGRSTVAVAALATNVVITVDRRLNTKMSTNSGRDFRPNMY